MASALVGVLIPSMMSGSQSAPSAEKAEIAASHDDAAEHGKAEAEQEKPPAADHGHGHGKHDGKDEKKPKEGPCFLTFGRMVVNLNEPNLIKFLSLEISLQTDAKYESEVKAALESRRPILTTWLTSHLADKSIEDIRGKVGVNRLRREIQDNFNSLLFKDGHERVQDIMFEEYHVQ